MKDGRKPVTHRQFLDWADACDGRDDGAFEKATMLIVVVAITVTPIVWLMVPVVRSRRPQRTGAGKKGRRDEGANLDEVPPGAL